MNRDELIGKAIVIEAEYYKSLKETMKVFGYNSEYAKRDAARWATAQEVIAELLDLTDEEYMKYFFGN